MVSNKCILEDERSQKCISCSSSDVNCFKSVDSTDQIMINEMYRTLIPPQNVPLLDGKRLLFCSTCVNTLKNILEFRQTCIGSLLSLSNTEEMDISIVKIEEETFIDELNIPIKIEIFKDDLTTKNSISLNTNEENSDSSKYCSICTLDFSKGIKEHIIKSHCVKSTTMRNVQCNICSKIYATKDKFYIHFKYHREYKEPKRCPNCTEFFKNMMDYTIHVRSHNPNNTKDAVRERNRSKKGLDQIPNSVPYCSLCSKHFPSAINDHIVDEHSTRISENKHTCLVCLKTYTTRAKFIVHFNFHRSYEQPKKCPHCELTFLLRMDYAKHTKTHNPNLFPQVMGIGANSNEPFGYNCDICKSSYSKIYRLKTHMIVKHLNGFQCKYCRKGFIIETEYNEHMKEEETKRQEKGIKQYVCETCGYTGKYRAYLLEHIKRFHTPDVPLITCDECGRTFKTKNHFSAHYASRHAEKKFHCAVCNKKFWYEKLLSQHIEKYHSENPPIQECPECKKVFDPKYLKLHMKTVHSGVRKHVCKICNAGFKTPGCLRAHMHSHSKTRPYNCNLCNTGYYQRDYLKKHYRREHGIFMTNEELREQSKELKSPIDV